LEKDSVAVVSQLGPVSREFIDPYPVGRLPAYVLAKISAGIRLATGV
jgi:mRNA interferase MazF